MVQAECRERGCCAALALRAPVRSRALRGCSSYAEATPIDAERKREPEGQPRRARGDDEASVARSAARGAYRHHHSTQHCAAQQPRHCIRLAQDLDNLGCASALLEQPRHCIRLAQDFAVVMIFIRNFRNEGIFSFALLNNLGSASALLEQARHCIRLAQDFAVVTKKAPGTQQTECCHCCL